MSAPLISQIEREMVIPSVVSIWRLAQALDTNINYFFDEDDVDDKVIIRKNDHRASSSTVIAATTSCSAPLRRSACWI